MGTWSLVCTKETPEEKGNSREAWTDVHTEGISRRAQADTWKFEGFSALRGTAKGDGRRTLKEIGLVSSG